MSFGRLFGRIPARLTWKQSALVFAVLLAVVLAVWLAFKAAQESYTAPNNCRNLFCSTGSSNGTNGRYSTGSKPREQFLNGGDGYCGELTAQVLMLKHGVYASQQQVRMVATGSAGGDVLVETESYRNIMDRFKMLAVQYRDKKNERKSYEAYIAFLKKWLVQGVGCAMVMNFKESDNTDGTYDHIVPVTGIVTKTPNKGYDPNDVLIVHTNFVPEKNEDVKGRPLELYPMKVGEYQCKGGRRGSWRRLDDGGCVPPRNLDRFAWAVGGPMYMGIGPPVELVMGADREPPFGSRATLSATVVVRGLTPGKSYKIFEFKDPNKVPTKPNARLTGTPWKTFKAAGAVHSVGTSFLSNEIRYYIAVAA